MGPFLPGHFLEVALATFVASCWLGLSQMRKAGKCGIDFKQKKKTKIFFQQNEFIREPCRIIILDMVTLSGHKNKGGNLL